MRFGDGAVEEWEVVEPTGSTGPLIALQRINSHRHVRGGPRCRIDTTEQSVNNLLPNTMYYTCSARAKALKNQRDNEPALSC